MKRYSPGKFRMRKGAYSFMVRKKRRTTRTERSAYWAGLKHHSTHADWRHNRFVGGFKFKDPMPWSEVKSLFKLPYGDLFR